MWVVGERLGKGPRAGGVTINCQSHSILACQSKEQGDEGTLSELKWGRNHACGKLNEFDVTKCCSGSSSMNT